MKPFIAQYSAASEKKKQKAYDFLTAGGGDIYFNSFMQQVYWPTTRDYPDCRVIITQDFVANYNIPAGHLQILPVRFINNIYKSSFINGKYYFNGLGLVAETPNGLFTFPNTVMLGKTDAKLDPVVYAVRSAVYQLHQRQHQ